jgi:hypothetical protein
MTGFMDEPDAVHGDPGQGNRDIERDEKDTKRRHSDQRSGDQERDRDPLRSTSNDDRIDEASDESFPASDPPQQP